MNYFICGFTGSGKTYLLKQLENAFVLPDYKFIDLDQLIDQEYAESHHSLAHLIEDIGFDAFRELELQKIGELSQEKNIFLGLGGGALNKLTLDLLDSGSWRGFWLNTDFETCIERIKNDENRPLSRLSSRELREIYNERLHFYHQFQEVSTLDDVLRVLKD